MKRASWLVPAAVAALALGSGRASAAPIVIDDFSVPQLLQASASDASPAVGSATGPAANVIGGARLAQITVTSSVGSARLDIHDAPAIMGGDNSTDTALYSNTFGANSDLLVVWNGSDVTANIGDRSGLGSFDLTDGGANGAIFVTYASDLPAIGTFTVFSNGGTNSSTRSWNFPGGNTGMPDTLPLTFASFSGDADFHDVSAVTLSLSGGSAFDGMIDILASRPVPEPATLTLLGFGLLGFGYMRRRQSRG